MDRNRTIQIVIDDFANNKIPLQGTQDDWAEFQSHFATLYKIFEPDNLGVPQFKWESSNGIDHFVHASVYWRVGMDRFKNDGGKIFTGELDMFQKVPHIQGDNTMVVYPKFIYDKNDDD